MARARSGWDDLSDAYRQRLFDRGESGELTGRAMVGERDVVREEVRRYWEGGGRLGVLEYERPSTAAPREATERESVGLGGPSTWAELERWRDRSPSAGGAPAWIPNDHSVISNDVAAILSQIDVPPSEWGRVQVTFGGTGEALMTVTDRDGRDQSVILPDGQAVGEVGRLLQDPIAAASGTREANVLIDEWGYDYDDPDFEPIDVDFEDS